MTVPLLRSRSEDAAPVEPAAVVLVPAGGKPPKAVIRRAVAEAAGGTVAVVVPLKIHGSAWGFPHPGLLPNAKEKDTARRDVEAAIAAVERMGGAADGHIIATRKAAKVIARTARRRQVRLVLIDTAPRSRMRARVEGDPAAAVRRRTGGIPVEVVERSST